MEDAGIRKSWDKDKRNMKIKLEGNRKEDESLGELKYMKKRKRRRNNDKSWRNSEKEKKIHGQS